MQIYVGSGLEYAFPIAEAVSPPNEFDLETSFVQHRHQRMFKYLTSRGMVEIVSHTANVSTATG